MGNWTNFTYGLEGMNPLEGAYEDIKVNRYNKIFIGKNLNTHPLTQLFLSFLEKINLTSFPKFYYKSRFKKLIPLFNDLYLEKELGLKRGSDAFESIKALNPTHAKKLIFKVKEGGKSLRALKGYFELKKDVLIYPLLDPETKLQLNRIPAEVEHLTLILKRYEELKEIGTGEFCLNLVSWMVKDKRFHELDTPQLKQYLRWSQDKIIDPDAPFEKTVERIRFLNHRHVILEHEPWMKHYLSEEALQQLKENKDIASQEIKELDACLQLIDLMGKHEKKVFFLIVDYALERKPLIELNEEMIRKIKILLKWHDDGILYIEKDYAYLKEMFLLLLVIHERFPHIKLKDFCEVFYNHPIYLDTKMTLADKIKLIYEGLDVPHVTAETLFQVDRIQQYTHIIEIKHYSDALTKNWGFEIMSLLTSCLQEETRCARKPLKDDPGVLHITCELEKLIHLKEELLIQASENERFLTALGTAAKLETSAPLSPSFYDVVTHHYLGREYQTCYELYKDKDSLKRKNLAERLKILITFSRSKPEALFLHSLLFHKLAQKYIQDFDYSYTEELRNLTNLIITTLRPESLPINGKILENTEQLLGKALGPVLRGNMSADEMAQVFRSCRFKDAGDAHLLETKISEYEETCKLKLKDPAYFEAITPRIMVRAIKSFFKSSLPQETIVAKSLDIIELKFDRGDDLHVCLYYLKKKSPEHFLHFLLNLLREDKLSHFFANDHLEVKKLFRKACQTYIEDLKKEPYLTLSGTYAKDKVAHFPHCYLTPILDELIYRVEQVRILKHSSSEDQPSPQATDFFLKNLESIVKLLEMERGSN